MDRPSGAREGNGTKLQEELWGMDEAGETAGHGPRLSSPPLVQRPAAPTLGPPPPPTPVHWDVQCGGKSCRQCCSKDFVTSKEEGVEPQWEGGASLF